MDLGLKGKVCMVSGASKGLGFAVARILALERAHVSICSSNKSQIEQAKKKIIGETGGTVSSFTADVRSGEAIEKWRDATLSEFGGIDGLFSNSGGPSAGEFMSLADAKWQEGFELLVLSAMRMARAVIPSMKTRGKGSILFSTSSSVKEPIPNLTLSNVLRGSVSALSKTLSKELAPFNIRVNQVMPGRIDTDRVRSLDALNAEKGGVSVAEVQKRNLAAIPLGRYGEPDEFAAGAVFLLSPASSYITGATLQIDGGFLRSVL